MVEALDSARNKQTLVIFWVSCAKKVEKTPPFFYFFANYEHFDNEKMELGTFVLH